MSDSFLRKQVLPAGTVGMRVWGHWTKCETLRNGCRSIPNVLSNDNTIRTRKQKFIGTRKQNSEVAAITKHAKDSDASSIDSHIKETQGTSSSMGGDDDEQSSQPCGQDHAGRDVEPRSYRDVVVNG